MCVDVIYSQRLIISSADPRTVKHRTGLLVLILLAITFMLMMAKNDYDNVLHC